MEPSAIADIAYRCPQDLRVTPTALRRVLVLGSCLIAGWPLILEKAEDGCPCDFLPVNNSIDLPEVPPRPAKEYDFQLVQMPLRMLIPDHACFRLPFGDANAYEELFREARGRLAQFLAAALRWSRYGLPTFVCNFLVPQQNPMGRLLPRYDLRNMVYFVEQLNESLSREIEKYPNVHLFDIDQIVATFGRRYFQDDAVYQTNHGAALTDYDFAYDQDRLEAAPRASEMYPSRLVDYLRIGWTELVAMYRTIRQLDQVKLVVVDADDTLWRGVQAERQDISAEDLEGWPLGMADGLCNLKRRGVLLALISRNDEDRFAVIWNRALRSRLNLEDFAIRKINWRPKTDNLEVILAELNLLPKSVVLIDDNPVERAAVEAAFPGMRTFGSNPLVWRRILLWSPETQVAGITAESAMRTEMVQAQIEREEQRQQLPRSEFLASLEIEVKLTEIAAPDHPMFPRAFELINKTNQFNTTGRRWTERECIALFASGGRFFAFDAQDRFTPYGIVGVLVVEAAHLAQFVMSCRVIGLDIETAVVAELLQLCERRGAATVTAGLIETESNLACRDLYHRCGFSRSGDTWICRTSGAAGAPSYIRISSGAAFSEAAA